MHSESCSRQYLAAVPGHFLPISARSLSARPKHQKHSSERTSRGSHCITVAWFTCVSGFEDIGLRWLLATDAFCGPDMLQPMVSSSYQPAALNQSQTTVSHHTALDKYKAQ